MIVKKKGLGAGKRKKKIIPRAASHVHKKRTTRESHKVGTHKSPACRMRGGDSKKIGEEEKKKGGETEIRQATKRRSQSVRLQSKGVCTGQSNKVFRAK